MKSAASGRRLGSSRTKREGGEGGEGGDEARARGNTVEEVRGYRDQTMSGFPRKKTRVCFDEIGIANIWHGPRIPSAVTL